jgi:beta-galactosidase
MTRNITLASKAALLLAVSFPVLGQQSAGNLKTKDNPGRLAITVNREWTFNYLPSGEPDDAPARRAFDDSHWPAIALPHTWSTFETTREPHPFIKSATERDDSYWWYGWGWYRKRFVIDPAMRGKRLFVEFDGVQKYSRVYLNGVFIGEHKGGYNSFCFDLTGHARFGEANLLAVRVSNRRDDNFGGIPPMHAGNYNVYGGIYRDVRLVFKDPLHIPYQGSADFEGGTFVTTPEVSAASAVVEVATWVRNDYPIARDCILSTVILDADNHVVASMEARHRIPPGKPEKLVRRSQPIRNPQLWSPGTPYLYRVRSIVKDGRRVADEYESPLGIRWFSWNYAEKALYVNGAKIHIHGTNRHQEYPWLGDAIPKWIHESDLRDIRVNLGHNFIRAMDYPPDPVVCDLTDRLGIIVVEEVPNIKDIVFGVDIQKQNVREMIRRDRNHPSVFFWSMGNETTHAADSNWAWEEDRTRLIHVRKGEGAGDKVTHTHLDLDLEHLLRCTIRGWYTTDDVASAREGFQGEPPDGQSAGTEEWQHKMARVADGSIRGRIDGLGGSLVAWVYADHGADRIYKYAPLRYVNPKGWVDSYRFPKYMYYLWQANYIERPMVFVHPHYWRSKYAGQKRPIVVDSNCSSVELKANGASLGTRHPDAANFHTVTFPDIPITQGVLEAEGRKDGAVVKHSVTMAGSPAAIVLTVSHPSIVADRAGISIVTADIVDAAGNHVYGAISPLTWKLAGPGSLVGPEVYQTNIQADQASYGAMYIDAPVANVVRSSNQPGRITVAVSSAGLKTGRAEIVSEAPPSNPGAFVYQPALSDQGRSPVRRDPSYRQPASFRGLGEIAEIDRHHRLSAASLQQARQEIERFVAAANPRLDCRTEACRILLDRLADSLFRNRGELVADEYNFLVRTHNSARKQVK